jgi:hypothetical protein
MEVSFPTIYMMKHHCSKAFSQDEGPQKDKSSENRHCLPPALDGLRSLCEAFLVGHYKGRLHQGHLSGVDLH